METAPARCRFRLCARRFVSATAEGCHFLCSCKESNQRNTPPGREPMLRIGALRFSANQGTAPNSLRSNTGASSPLIPLRCSARSRRTGRSRSTARASTHGADLLGAAFAFDVGSALSEPSTAGPARAKRCGCLSAASSRTVPRRAEERRAPACAARRLAAGGAFLWLLSLRAKKVTPLRGRGNDPGTTNACAHIQKRPARGQAFLHYRRSRETYATVDARSAAMRSSSGGWLMNSFFAVEPEMPKAAIWVGNVLWP